MKEMKNRSFLKFILILCFALAYLPVTAGDQDDVWPWPWGTECPFDWDKFEGEWTIKGKERSPFFEFQLMSVGEDGDRYFRIYHYDQNGWLLALGTGYSAPKQRIIRAALFEPEGQEGYWAIVRSYSKDRQKSCQESKNITALTTRPFDKKFGVKDRHYVIKKVGDDDSPVQK